MDHADITWKESAKVSMVSSKVRETGIVGDTPDFFCDYQYDK